MAKIPLGREEVNPGKPGNCGHTPLVDAARRRKEVNPDKPDISGRTPPQFAAWSGYEKMVKILLGREEVTIDKLGTVMKAKHRSRSLPGVGLTEMGPPFPFGA